MSLDDNTLYWTGGELIYISLFIGIIFFFSILFVLLCVGLATLNILIIKINDNLSLLFIKLY